MLYEEKSWRNIIVVDTISLKQPCTWVPFRKPDDDVILIDSFCRQQHHHQQQAAAQQQAHAALAALQQQAAMGQAMGQMGQMGAAQQQQLKMMMAAMGMPQAMQPPTSSAAPSGLSQINREFIDDGHSNIQMIKEDASVCSAYY